MNDAPTLEDLVDTFRAGWHDADHRGAVGERTAAGIQAMMDAFPNHVRAGSGYDSHAYGPMSRTEYINHLHSFADSFSEWVDPYSAAAELFKFAAAVGQMQDWEPEKPDLTVPLWEDPR